MALQANDGPIPFLPDLSPLAVIRQGLGPQNLRMNANDEHFLVVRAVKNDDFAALREVARGAPEEIVPKLRRTRVAVAKETLNSWVV
jgi:hypothetical protein